MAEAIPKPEKKKLIQHSESMTHLRNETGNVALGLMGGGLASTLLYAFGISNPVALFATWALGSLGTYKVVHEATK